MKKKPTDDYGYDIDRAKQRAFAHRRGYFWLPCPICGFEYGGHESSGSPHMPIKGRESVFQGVCRRHPNAASEFIYVEAHAERVADGAEPKFGVDWTCEAHGDTCAKQGLDWDCSKWVMNELGWWAIEGALFIEALRRANAGEPADLIYAELYANSRTERDT
jgi:hypothetical protein